ncbi:MFS transporter [Oceanobacillus piezotolerans]|uniref:MFS transporter n=1 Tax=Oceanobacillus piezotolerans TaxID=2448030 RepID=A0A498DIV5_9BACI|nr:MFS transporter [Oceanobacillus piezotolerans]
MEKMYILIFLFIISFIMRIGTPIFTPYAAAFGATSVLIGLILGFTSFSDLTGNLIAGPLVDRFGKKIFITIPLFTSGALFIAHGLASNSKQLFILHGLNGFALAFLIPAAIAMLSGYARNSREQGKNIAINGILTTIAGMVAPFLGGKMADVIGYSNTYFIIGAAILATALFATFLITERQFIITHKKKIMPTITKSNTFFSAPLLTSYLIGFAVMYIHGVVIFEVPYLTVEEGLSPSVTGKLFSFLSLGAFITLFMFFINRYDPLKRLLVGLLGMCLSLYGIFSLSLSLPLMLFLTGIFFGLVMPAMATVVTENVPRENYGKAFGIMSAVYSLGMILSSILTGIIREYISPYFIAFLIGMLVVAIVGYTRLRLNQIMKPKGDFY